MCLGCSRARLQTMWDQGRFSVVARTSQLLNQNFMYIPFRTCETKRNWGKVDRHTVPLLLRFYWWLIRLYSNPVLMSQYEKCSTKAVKSCFVGTFPIFSWLHSYKKDDFVGDVISGCTVAIMHIPQGMGYALLGNFPPVVGIYMAFFPVLMYVVFGTSRHNSMGTNHERVETNSSSLK